uniref:5-oxoprolinase n=1 Tax=Ditylenchus dipsaci TaxID=166011 RepID=A0A915E116_9BILA
MSNLKSGLGFGIDRGGTFTDVFVVYSDGKDQTFKLLSEDPNYADAPTEAIRRILNQFTGVEVKRGEKIPTDNIAWIRMGTTVATNALLERRGESTALLITKGFKDLLYIGNQSRPNIFDFDIKIPDPLYDKVIEINERVLLEDETCQMNIAGQRIVTGNGKKIIVEKPVCEQEIEEVLAKLRAEGINSLAVLFLHSYIFPDHEKLVEKIARNQGFENISISSAVIPMIKAVPRGFTTCADAYLTPIIQKYIQGFRSGFIDNLKNTELEFMQSDGGLCPVENFIGSRAILSGPAGGVVGVSQTAFNPDNKEPIIGFDMGGTSTDVSRYDGQFNHVLESITAGVTIQAPQLEINTVAAGGGSRLFFRNGLFVVGPESAGSTPGPICYRKNGYLTVTDANLVLGRIIPEYFPHIFGPTEDQPLDKQASMAAFEELAGNINTFLQSEGRSTVSVPQVALGFIQVANESMCRPIRTLTEARGYDTSAHVLACFGGAGGQHACSVARSLGMRKVKIHKYAGILSAYGLALADVVNENQEAYIKPLTDETFWDIEHRFQALEERCTQTLMKQKFSAKEIAFERILHMRYEKTDCVLMCTGKQGDKLENFKSSFMESYQREFGFTIPDRTIIIDDIRVRGIARRYLLKNKQVLEQADSKPSVKAIVKCWFEEGELDTSVYDLPDLHLGDQVQGPSIIIDKNCTVLVEPNCNAQILDDGSIEIELMNVGRNKIDEKVDPIQLSIFSHRFMSIAEQMGSVLQRSSISTNIKERLDFSCALFGPDGGLVANAPHIPVHLGGMQATVRFQIEHLGPKGISRGDVILCNHPKAGGSHLPDLTIITPVFFSDNEQPDFFLANRGHHSDIGGLVPGVNCVHKQFLDETVFGRNVRVPGRRVMAVV